jgi:hypothetical protein
MILHQSANSVLFPEKIPGSPMSHALGLEVSVMGVVCSWVFFPLDSFLDSAICSLSSFWASSSASWSVQSSSSSGSSGSISSDSVSVSVSVSKISFSVLGEQSFGSFASGAGLSADWFRSWLTSSAHSLVVRFCSRGSATQYHQGWGTTVARRVVTLYQMLRP